MIENDADSKSKMERSAKTATSNKIMLKTKGLG